MSIINFSSRLKHNITFFAKESNTSRWSEVLSCFAEIKALYRYKPIITQNLTFGNLTTEDYYLFTIRFSSTICINMRIKFAQRRFEIHRIINPLEQNHNLEIFAFELHHNKEPA
ncbi:head-tail adaptor protein [Orientia tsutsugamushi]|uniref:Phage head-tail joining family protein n=1 Tax=Orientia tsutsugamushi str. TA716 TaxID=1359175 RepID=A0A0F3P9S8_ORITS|nr:head-tail adaptor protein [Orientia tsutsugamushi]KJV76697.1 phage head-tail joining family protein [Orientia tsutsugamushi str. TA716]